MDSDLEVINMTAQTAITQADTLRPNNLDASLKLKWLDELDAELAEMMNIDMPEPCDADTMLLMPSPYDQVYPYHLMVKIDFALEETDLYMLDSAVANRYLGQAKAWWRRNHRPDSRRRFEVMN